MPIRHTSHARYELWYHFAFSTKYRKKIWKDDERKVAVEKLFRNIAEQYDMEIATIALLSDHIHFSITAPPRIAPARIAQILKSVSTKALFAYYPELKRQYWGGEVWVRGYFVRSAGPGLTKEQIDKYIREQTEEY
jgi:putative transposase